MTSDTIRRTLDELLLDKEGAENEARAFFLSQIIDQLREISSQTDAEKQLRKLHLIDTNDNLVAVPPPPPPPPLPIIQMKAPPPPPPPPPAAGLPPPPPPLLLLPKVSQLKKPEVGGITPAVKKLECPSSMLPKKEKKTKTRTVQWSKINANTVQDDSVWGKLAKASSGVDIDFDLLDNFFGIESINRDGENEQVKKKTSRKEAHVELLTSKRSQNVAIMLKQFKNVDEFIESVGANRPVAEMDALQNLFGMLPQGDEEEALKRYTGDILLLSPPSAFFYRLVAIPFYRLRIETLIFLSDFSRLMQELAPNVEVLISASREILTSPTLPRLLLILVNMGNYLNSNNSQGNAFGFTLNSMWKLIDLKGNKQEFSLLHLLVTCEPDLVEGLQSELSTLKDASQISFDEIKNSLKSLKDHRQKLEKQLEMRSSDDFQQFLELVKIDCHFELQDFESRYQELQDLQKDLADYFCENRNTFQLDECLKIFTFLLNRLNQAHKEHVSRESRRMRKEEKREKEKERVETQTVKKEKKEDLFETLNGTSNDNTELTRKRVSDILDVRQKLGNVRVRKINNVIMNPIENFQAPPPLESPTGSSKENEQKSPTEPAKTSTNYENCNDLESYISSLTKKRASHVAKEKEKQPEVIATSPPPKPQPPEPERESVPLRKSPQTVKSLKPPSTISRPSHLKTPSYSPPSPTVRIVSVTSSVQQKTSDGPSKLAELRKPGARSPPNSKPTPTLKTPVTRTSTTPRVVVPARTASSSTGAGINSSLSRRMSAPVVRKPTMTAEKKREITMKPSVSTSARPSLINTSSSPIARSSLPKMSVLEKPKPLRITPQRPTVIPQPPPKVSGIRPPTSVSKPKWV